MAEGPIDRRGSAAARVGLCAYAVLILYASWYPFSGWQSIGVQAWEYLFEPLPYYWTRFDLLANIVGYVPLGALGTLALYPKLRGAPAALAAFLLGTVISALLEAGQTFLPSRVASNLDLVLNAGGSLLGAVAGIFLSPLLQQSRLATARNNWFNQDASSVLIVMALWPLAQIYPRGYLFGHGQMLPLLSAWLSHAMETRIDLSAIALRGIQLTVQEYWLAETIITASGLTGAVLTMLCVLRKQAPMTLLVLMVTGAALTVKSLASALVFGPDNTFAWLTPGAQGGLLIGAMMIAGLTFAPPNAQRRLAAFSLLLGIAVANIVPANPYFVATLQSWMQGKFLNFSGAAQFLSFAWPFFALWFLLHPMHRRRRRAPA